MEEKWHILTIRGEGGRGGKSSISARSKILVSPFSKTEILILGGYRSGRLGDGYLFNT